MSLAPKPKAPDTIDLGWVKLSRDDFRSPSDLWPFAALRHGYWGVLGKEHDQPERYGRCTLETQWFVSEIEDIVRYSLMLFDKVVIETPLSLSSAYLTNCFSEERTYCEWSFFDFAALTHVQEAFGDAIAGKEVLLLPSFNPTWDEFAEPDEEGRGGSFHAASPYAVEEMFKPLNAAWPRLAQCRDMSFQNALLSEAQERGASAGLPLISGGSIRDLILLRRDEADAFGRWRAYLDQELHSGEKSPSRIQEAVDQGIAELGDRLRAMKTKGYLDAMGATLVSGAAAIACFVEGKPTSLSGAVALSASIVTMLKAIVQHRMDRRPIERDKLYFAWLARRLR